MIVGSSQRGGAVSPVRMGNDHRSIWRQNRNVPGNFPTRHAGKRDSRSAGGLQRNFSLHGLPHDAEQLIYKFLLFQMLRTLNTEHVEAGTGLYSKSQVYVFV